MSKDNYLEVEAFFETYKSLPVEKQKLVMEYQYRLIDEKEKNEDPIESDDNELK